MGGLDKCVIDNLTAILPLYFKKKRAVFENHRKSIIQHCERSELHLHFEWAKVN